MCIETRISEAIISGFNEGISGFTEGISGGLVYIWGVSKGISGFNEGVCGEVGEAMKFICGELVRVYPGKQILATYTLHDTSPSPVSFYAKKTQEREENRGDSFKQIQYNLIYNLIYIYIYIYIYNQIKSNQT